MLSDEERRAAKNAYKQRARDEMWDRLGLDAGQLADLLDHLDEDADGCDGELTRTREWALDAGLGWPPLEERLRELGGGCDCEVLANLDPAAWL
ncbi:DUF2695 domain-containing protein [Amycolatopsis sp. MtRt-6]|uniref:DUF2695 domain-containing protein n=1 Tax=Amycolatopsis sp. MtRt-6 TaxID=2792782 RepID=UPI001A8EE309|nr:DUF2695 domain-containing protein [Amycolatopsis sp. MtRt-6]